MKRFRFETIHLVMIGMIVFGLLAISVRLIQSETGLLMKNRIFILWELREMMILVKQL